ncbi:MAG: metal ABC transporter ATP-binding protein [Simkaniaceae bacterium]|nr:metal ABC transporter ATP-binding protein [Simkaniaceae bacterium]
MSKKIVTIKDLCFSYRDHHALKKVTVSIEKGAFIGVIGPNGGGKTTFLKILMGLLSPSKGKVIAPTAIGYVPQILSYDRLFPITLLEMVLMGSLSKISLLGSYPKSAHEEALSHIAKVGLEKKIHHPLSSLSGGELQRALFARALMGNPEILYLDEPTANIDSATEQIILKLLTDLKGKKTIVMVTHHLQTIIGTVDRVFCIQNELQDLTPDEVCTHFAYGSYHAPLLKDKDCDHE